MVINHSFSLVAIVTVVKMFVEDQYANFVKLNFKGSLRYSETCYICVLSIFICGHVSLLSGGMTSSA